MGRGSDTQLKVEKMWRKNGEKLIPISKASRVNITTDDELSLKLSLQNQSDLGNVETTMEW